MIYFYFFAFFGFLSELSLHKFNAAQMTSSFTFSSEVTILPLKADLKGFQNKSTLTPDLKLCVQ